MKTAKKILSGIDSYIKLAGLAKTYFEKDRSWLYHKLNENTVNGVEYAFTSDELAILADGLADISQKIKQAAIGLRRLQKNKEREAGRHYTVSNPFDHPLFVEWLSLVPTDKRWLEPFAGACDIPHMIAGLGIKVAWECFDIARTSTPRGNIRFTRRDTIANFPTGYQVCVTNPPYLHKNSATRRGLLYPETCYDDIYKHCLSLMLTNCEYVAAIIPDSFIGSGLFQGRLYGVISLNRPMFEKTDCPVCLALFTPNETTDFDVWNDNKMLGRYSELRKHDLSEWSEGGQWRFNDPQGSIAIKCVDGKTNADIHFMAGSEIEECDVKKSNRSYVRIGGLPDNISLIAFIETCNKLLQEYRQQTHDCFLTSYGGLRKDGYYRKRITFKIIRRILNRTLCQFLEANNV